MMQVAKNTVVSIRYVMRNSKGEILEDTLKAAPTNYLHGSDGIQHLLQVQLEGLEAGASKLVYLFKESGLTDDDFTFEVIIDDVRQALPEELVLGYPVIINTTVCDDDCECYDNGDLG